MDTNVRAMLLPKDNPSSLWVATQMRSRSEGKLVLPGGKMREPELIIPALLRELGEETCLPPQAADHPAGSPLT